MTKDTLQRLERIDHLIRIKGTGTAAELGDRLGLSRATVYEYLNLMKLFGAPIKFCKFRQSYYYNEDGCFTTRFVPKRVLNSFAPISLAFILLTNP